MTPDEHNKERMRAWTAFRSACGPCDLADKALAEFDKRFPAPAAVDTDRERRENLHCVISDLTDQCREANTELAALREKARYWDAMWPVWYGQEDDAIHAAQRQASATEKAEKPVHVRTDEHGRTWNLYADGTMEPAEP